MKVYDKITLQSLSERQCLSLAVRNTVPEVCKTQKVHLRTGVKMLRTDIVKSLLWSVEDIQWKSNNSTVKQRERYRIWLGEKVYSMWGLHSHSIKPVLLRVLLEPGKRADHFLVYKFRFCKRRWEQDWRNCLGHPVVQDWAGRRQVSIWLNTSHHTSSSAEYRSEVSGGRHIYFFVGLFVFLSQESI